jgi:predicted CoA-binding protein
MWINPTDDEIKHVLSDSRRIAVVGLSPNPARPSNEVSRVMQREGYRITGVNPRCGSIPGFPCVPSLGHIPVEESPDIVTVFRRSSEAGVHVGEAVLLRPKCIWLQTGVIDEAAGEAARRAGIMVVMDRCIAVERRRLLGSGR